MFATKFPDDPDVQPIIGDDVLAQCFYNVNYLLLQDVAARPHAPLQVVWVSPDKSRESIWKSMNGLGPKKGGYSFQGYMKDASVSIMKCKNLNTYVVKDAMDALMTILWEQGRRASGKKYEN